jgi:hypothetical protein
MMSVSLDGYFEGPDHDLGWHLISEGCTSTSTTSCGDEHVLRRPREL